MFYKIVAIRDRAADAYGVPAFVASIGAATRSFGDECNNKESALGQHPEDYDLYLLGEYDDSVGVFLTEGPPRMIAVGKDMVRV